MKGLLDSVKVKANIEVNLLADGE